MKDLASQTLEICRAGQYAAPSGAIVSISSALRAALEGTRLVEPGAVLPSVARGGAPRIEVTHETTSAAGRRLAGQNAVALNFASARNVGGGFLNGAKAQEEDLCRCSGLFPCLETQPRYYQANRAADGCLYTDHAIYSPKVPFFRDDRLNLLETPYTLSVITSPAPNARELDLASGALTRGGDDVRERIRETFHRRALQVLQLAAHFGHRTVILGAWGCGAFRNDPHDAADAFAAALEATQGAFDLVTFAVFERQKDLSRSKNFSVFQKRFDPASYARLESGRA